MRTLALAVCLFASAAFAGDEVTIKLGTLAPQGSTWHALLKELAERWSEASGGKVKLKIYAGGTQGSEGDMVRKMGVGQLQAASITNVGMHDVIPEPMVFSAPGMVNDRTFAPIFAKVEGELTKRFEDKGYVVLNWADIGNVYIFCTQPYETPAAAKAGKFFAWDGDPGAIEAFRRIGFNPVVLASTDIVPSLQTGLITCLSQAPAYVLTARMFEKANKMVDYPWSYLFGATIVKKEVWEKIPADVRPKLLAVAKELGERINAEAKKLNNDAVSAMKKQGLTAVTPANLADWDKAATDTWPAVRGKSIPEAFFDKVVAARKEVLAEPAPAPKK